MSWTATPREVGADVVSFPFLFQGAIHDIRVASLLKLEFERLRSKKTAIDKLCSIDIENGNIEPFP